MKILRIHFKNIHSLKGEHCVDFEKYPLVDSGIFAITGPTGAGKSTLLDVMTLALFNGIPRISKNLSKNEIETMGSVITLNTNDAFAEVHYETGGNAYRSRWSIKRNRNHKLNEYHMELADLKTGKLYPFKRSEVKKENERIIGLTYKQFVKSILLSQGEFSRFLKADKNERAELLESLTDSLVYRELSILCFQTFKEEKIKLESDKEHLDSISIINDEEVLKLDEKLLTLTNREKELVSHLNHLRNQVNIREQLDKQRKVLHEIDRKLNKLEEQSAVFEQKKIKLELHHKLMVLMNDFDKLNGINDQLEGVLRDIKLFKDNVSSAQKGIDRAIMQFSSISNIQVSETSFNEKLRKYEKELLNIGQEMRQVQLSGQILRDDINRLRARSAFEISKRIKNDESPSQVLLKLEVRLRELTSMIKGLVKIENSSIADLENEILSLDKLLETLMPLIEKNQHFDNQKKRLLQFKNEQINLTRKLDKIKPELKKLTRQSGQLKTGIQMLEKQKMEQLKKLDLSELRKELIDGQACPLCGAIHHPFAHDVFEIGDLEIELIKTQKDFDRLEEKRQILKDQVTAIDSNQLQLDEIQIREQKTLETLASEINRLKISMKEEGFVLEKDINFQTTQLRKKLANSKLAVQSLKEIDLLQEYEEQFSRLNALMANYNRLKSQFDKKYQGHDFEADCKKLDQTFNELSLKKDHFIKSIALHEEKNKNLQSTKHQLIEYLDKETGKLGFKHHAEAQTQILPKEEFEALSNEKNTLEENRVKLALLKNENEKATKTLESNLIGSDAFEDILGVLESQERIQTNLNREIGALRKTLDHNRRQKEEFQLLYNKYRSREKEFENLRLLNELIGSAKGDKFANYAQGLTLANLIAKANIRLADLSDRYLLDKSKDLDELLIIDLYQGQLKRAVSTLSGGETFLISLALALSMSDMASQKISLESLFIDEGFGTLDSETLDIAITTLEKLQHDTHKTIGVISHVKDLKDRISTQIRVKKNHMGFSNLEIV